MKYLVGGCLVLAALCLAVPGDAQTRAKAENVAEIPFESVPNFLKMPPDVYLGESMGVATNSKGTSSSIPAETTRVCSSSIPTGTSSRNGARGSTASSSRTRCG